MVHSPQGVNRVSAVVRTSLSLLIGTLFTALVICYVPGTDPHDLNASEQSQNTKVELNAQSDQHGLQLALLNQKQKPNTRSGNSLKLPDYFTQIDLSEEQVKQVRKVQQKHQTEIEKYQSLLDQKKGQRDDELQDLLSRDQKRKLETLKKKASIKRRNKSLNSKKTKR